jgi:hypothetical protein
MKLEIEQKVAQAVVDYLVQKPYREVAALIAELLKLTPAKEDKAAKEGKEVLC